MKRKHTATINTGSMADIAFLLLIFFLLSTTIETDEGIQQKLPKWSENPSAPLPEKYVLDIKIDKSDELLINGEAAERADHYTIYSCGCRIKNLKYFVLR